MSAILYVLDKTQIKEARRKTYQKWLETKYGDKNYGQVKDGREYLLNGTNYMLKGMGVHLWSDIYDIYTERRIMKMTNQYVWFCEILEDYGLCDIIKVKRDSIYGYAMTELSDNFDRGYYDMDEK